MHLAKQMMDFDNIADCENELTDFSAKINAAFGLRTAMDVLSIQTKRQQKHLPFRQTKRLHLMKMHRS